MALTKRKLKDNVHTKVDRKIIKKMVSFAEKNNPNLCGQNKWKKFVKDNVYLTLYKDLTRIDSIKLSNKTRAWYTPTAKSLHHNCQEMRRVFITLE